MREYRVSGKEYRQTKNEIGRGTERRRKKGERERKTE